MKSIECDELLYGERFPLKLEMAVYKSYVILYESEMGCQKENKMGFLQRT